MPSRDLDRLVVKIDADTERLRRELRRLDRSLEQTDRKASRLTLSMQRRLKAAFASVARSASLLAVAMGAGAVAFGAHSVQVAADAEELRGKFRAVFKDASDSVLAWIDETSAALGRGRVDLEGYLATLQDTFVPLGFARGRAAELSKEVTKLALDLAAFNNAAEPETIQLLTSALVGNHEAVRRFGIVITQARLDQELLNMGFEGGAKSATELQKAQARLNLIFRDSADAQGAAERESGNFNTATKRLSGALKDLQVAIGNELTPAATDLLNLLTDLADATRRWFELFSDTPFAEQSLDTLKERLKDIREETAVLMKLLAERPPQPGRPGSAMLLEQRSRTLEQLEKLDTEAVQIEEELARRREKVAESERKAAEESAKTAAQSAQTVKAAGASQVATTEKTKTAAEELTETLVRENQQLAKLIEAYRMSRAQIELVNAATEVDNELRQAGIDLKTKEGQATAKLILANREYKQDLELVQEIQRQSLTPMDEYTQRVERLGDAFERRSINSQQFAAGMEQARRRLVDTDPVLRGLGDGFDRLGQGIAESMTRSGNAMENFRDLAKNIADDILNTFLQLAAINPLKNELFGLSGQSGFPTLGSLSSLGSLFGGGGSAFSASTFAGTGLSGFTGAGTFGFGLFGRGGVFQNGRVKKFASGGLVTGPTAFPITGGTGLMGESGPEAIMPLAKMPGGGLGVKSQGGNRTHVTISLDGANGNEEIRRIVVEGLREALPGFTETAVQTVIDRRAHDPDLFGAQG